MDIALSNNGLQNQGPDQLNSVVCMPKQNKSEFIQYQCGIEGQLLPEQTLNLIGEKGQRTALSNYGLQEGCFYFEVEMLPPLIPLPFLNVLPALRIGYSCLPDQDLELPIGSNLRSYGYSSPGKLINAGKTSCKNMNEPYEQGDVVGALISLKPLKPKFLQQKQKDEEGFEVSDGSYIEFYKNGVKQMSIFSNIFEGTYYAGISLYMQAQCRVNFGDQPFKFPPQKSTSTSILEQWKPYRDLINAPKITTNNLKRL